MQEVPPTIVPTVSLLDVDEAASILKEYGVCGISSCFSEEDLVQIDANVAKLKPKKCVARRKHRFDYVLDPTDPLFQSIFSEKEDFRIILSKVLGSKYFVEKAGKIESSPGSVAQRWHMDTPHLFSNSVQLPAHSLNCFIAMCDLIPFSNGPTEFQLKTHIKANIAEPKTTAFAGMKKGSIVIYDTRILHRGGPNNSQEMRPLIYLTFSRAWFRDVINP